MRLIECRNGIEVYDVENGYTISKEIAKWFPGCSLIKFYSKHDSYLPEIFQNNLIGGEDDADFIIQTTSYGSLPPEEIKKVISGYEVAIQTIEAVRNEFFKKG